MDKGVGNLESRFLEAVKSRRLRCRRNLTFLRMYIFLNPFTTIIVQDWKQIVRPHQLRLKVAQPIDMRSYRQRVQDRLDLLAKKYKKLCINSKTRFRTLAMMQIQEKMDHLTDIVAKFNFVEDYSDCIAIKQHQAWEKNIVILKKGEKNPHQINSFEELKAVAHFFQPPTPKKLSLHLIGKKQHLDRIYLQVRRKAKYYGLIERPNFHKQFELFQELSHKAYVDVQKMEAELPGNKIKLEKNMHAIEIQFNEDSKTAFTFTHNHSGAFGRSYLVPRVMVKGRNNPLTIEEIGQKIKNFMNQSWVEEKPQKIFSENTKSKDITQITVFSAEKSLMQSDWLPQQIFELSKPSIRQFHPQSNLSLYSLGDISHFPRPNATKKGFWCMDYQRCSGIGCEKWLSGTLYDCMICNAAYHEECWPQTNFCRICPSISTNLPFSFNFTPEECFQFKLMDKILISPPQPLFPEETATAIKQIQSNFPNQFYCVTNCFQEDFKIYPFYNSQLRQLHHDDQKIIDEYEKQNLAFPVIVKEINSVKGRGLIARRPIMKGQLVATYSGNVVSLAQITKYSEAVAKNYLFHLISGPDIQTNLIVYPTTFASAGFFMNHADSKRNKSKINVKTLIALHKNRPIIIMQATKKIAYGKQLLYDYNSEYAMYDTHNFE